MRHLILTILIGMFPITTFAYNVLMSLINRVPHSRACSQEMTLWIQITSKLRHNKRERLKKLSEKQRDIKRKCPFAFHKFFVVK